MRRFILTLLVLAVPVQAGRNLVVNGSFEFTANGMTLGWSWSAGRPLGAWTDLVTGTKGTGSEFTLAPLAFRMIQLD